MRAIPLPGVLLFLTLGCSSVPFVDRPLSAVREIPVECGGGIQREGLSDPGLTFEPLEEADPDALIDVDIFLYWADCSVAEAILGDFVPGVYGRVVDGSDAEQILARAAKRSDVSLLSKTGLTLAGAQAGSLSLVSETSYVSGFRLAGAPGAILYEPEIGVAREGFNVVVTATSEPGSNRFALGVRVESANVQRPISTMASDVLGGRGLTIEIPVFNRFELQGDAEIASGQALLLAGPDPSMNDRYLLALVTPH